MLYTLNKRGERIHPCLTSLSKEEKLVLLSPDRMTYFNFEYTSEKKKSQKSANLFCCVLILTVNHHALLNQTVFGTGAGLGGGCRGRAPPPPPPLPRDDLRFSNTTGILKKKKKPVWFIGVEVEQEASAPLLKKILDPPLWKSTKQQNSLPLFSLLTYSSIRVLIKIKIGSVVRYPRRKPIWEECKIF